jgi:hypothetical protein
MATFQDFLDSLKTELAEFAENNWQTYRDAAIKDGNAFIDKARGDLERWTVMLSTGGLSREDFEWLLKGKKDLAELETLKQLGLAQTALDTFIGGLIGTIVSTAFKILL